MNKKELPWRTNNAELNCPSISENDLVGASYIVQDREPLLFLAILHYKPCFSCWSSTWSSQTRTDIPHLAISLAFYRENFDL